MTEIIEINYTDLRSKKSKRPPKWLSSIDIKRDAKFSYVVYLNDGRGWVVDIKRFLTLWGVVRFIRSMGINTDGIKEQL